MDLRLDDEKVSYGNYIVDVFFEFGCSDGVRFRYGLFKLWEEWGLRMEEVVLLVGDFVCIIFYFKFGFESICVCWYIRVWVMGEIYCLVDEGVLIISCWVFKV